ncbi:TNT domain-containing protein [Xenorhabdus griffiniae]
MAGDDCGNIKQSVLDNIAASKTARESSNFKTHMWEKEWPPNRGFYEGKFEKYTLQPGTRLDRYGTDWGTFVAPEGIPYSSRALKPGSDGRPYSVFVVKKPITADAGEIAPWFGYPGRGIQYDLPKKVNELIADGSLEKISVTVKGKPIPF